MTIEKTFKLSKKIRENYGGEWPSGLKISVTRNFKEKGISFQPVKIGKIRKMNMYICNEETWNKMPVKMKKGFEKIM